MSFSIVPKGLRKLESFEIQIWVPYFYERSLKGITMFVKYVNCTGAALFVSFSVFFMENAFLLTASKAFDFEATSTDGRATALKKKS
jgi:hypothetical protein